MLGGVEPSRVAHRHEMYIISAMYEVSGFQKPGRLAYYTKYFDVEKDYWSRGGSGAQTLYRIRHILWTLSGRDLGVRHSTIILQ
jgi:hypothetical protein